MDFVSVYNSLLDVFPEIDTRVLRAVAIEHPRNIEKAVEAVLTEIIPYLTKKNIPFGLPSGAEESRDLPVIMDDRHLIELPCLDAPANASDSAVGDSSKSYVEDGDVKLVPLATQEESTPVSSEVNCSLFHENNVEANPKDGKASCDNENENADQCIDDGQDFDEPSVFEVHEEDIFYNSHSDTSQLQNYMPGELQTPVQEFTLDTSAENFQLEPIRCDDFEESHKLNSSGSLSDNSLLLTPRSVENEDSQPIIASDGDTMREVIDFEEPHKINSSGSLSDNCLLLTSRSVENEDSQPIIASDGDTTNREVNDFESEHSLNTFTRSGQLSRIDMLEELIEDAKDNKKTLFNSMEIVIGLMKEVELQEQAADCAKKDAARGGLDILTRVDELKEMLLHAREANEMHSGEVYGERAILATEVRELQSRLFNLSDERDKSLNVLKEMREALEQRSLEAQQVINRANDEKLIKENAARRALTEQELIMEKVVEESRILKQEAEENTKLSEFLMDRGRVVDILQGEISVICKDVKLLKQKFDDRLPLCQSLCTNQTSCLLASSSSSMKSSNISPEEMFSSEENEKTISIPTFASDDIPPSPVTERRAPSSSDVDSLVDDGWELFDNRELA